VRETQEGNSVGGRGQAYSFHRKEEKVQKEKERALPEKLLERQTTENEVTPSASDHE